jgi:hypothetical protein
VRAEQRHLRAGGAVEETELEQIAAEESPERLAEHAHQRAALAARVQRLGGRLGVALALGERLRERDPAEVEHGALDAADARCAPARGLTVEKNLFVDAARRIEADLLAQVEAQVAIGGEAAVAQADAAEVVLEGDGERELRERVGRRVGDGAHLGGELGARALVGVEREHPAAARGVGGELVLSGEVVEGPLDEAGSAGARDLPGAIARAAIDHQHLVAEAERGEAVGQARLFILRDHRRREADGARGAPSRRALPVWLVHSRDPEERNSSASALVEWSLGSPQITVRPPNDSTSARSGTLSTE